jgi:hypothetical protein
MRLIIRRLQSASGNGSDGTGRLPQPSSRAFGRHIEKQRAVQARCGII